MMISARTCRRLHCILTATTHPRNCLSSARPLVGNNPVFSAVSSAHTMSAQAAPEISMPQDTTAYVRVTDGDPNISITLTYAGKQRTLNRPVDEPVEKAFARLRANVAPKPSKDKKKKGKPDPPTPAASSVDEAADLPIALYEDEAASRDIPSSTLALEAWRRAVILRVGADLFSVSYNPPTAEKVVLSRRPMVGFPVLARAKLLFAEEAHTQWSWARQHAGSQTWTDVGCAGPIYTPSAEDMGCTLRVECVPAASHVHTNEIGTAADGGASQKKRVRLGPATVAITDVVEAAPHRTAAMIRCSHTPIPTTPPAFRILSYNLLADQYAGSTYAQNVLFNYCPAASLDPEYRRQLALQELRGYNADVMCLQEVDEKAFTDFLQPHLAALGYEGHYTNKQGKVREGSATFWRTSRFARVLSQDIQLRDVFMQPLAAAHVQWQPMLDASPDLVVALQKVTTIAQATLLAPVGAVAEGARLVCVVNTHLFYHPYAPHIRAMHTAAILEEVAAVLDEVKSGKRALDAPGQVLGRPADSTSAGAQQLMRQVAGHRITTLFCGDLNSDLNDGVPGVVQLLQSGRLPATHWDWAMGATFKWGMGEEEGTEAQQAAAPQPPNSAIAQAVAAAKASAAAQEAAAQQAGTRNITQSSRQESLESTKADDGHAFTSVPTCPIAVTGIDVVSPFVMRSADDLKTPFTNYTSGYKALLDYVWIQPEDLRVVKSVPVPSEAEIGSFIPSPVFPSDHLAVVYDLEWN